MVRKNSVSQGIKMGDMGNIETVNLSELRTNFRASIQLVKSDFSDQYIADHPGLFASKSKDSQPTEGSKESKKGPR